MKILIVSLFFSASVISFASAQTAGTSSTAGQSRLGQKAETIVQSLKQELNLSPSQVELIKAITLTSLEQTHEVMANNGGDTQVSSAQIKNIKLQGETDLQKVLTPQQWSLYQTKKQAGTIPQ